MNQVIAMLVESLFRLLLPARGRHRATSGVFTHSTVDRPSPLPVCMSRPALRGEDVGLVRPYLVAHERSREQRLQRRRTLWLALHGFDTGPEWIHGVRVGAS